MLPFCPYCEIMIRDGPEPPILIPMSRKNSILVQNFFKNRFRPPLVMINPGQLVTNIKSTYCTQPGCRQVTIIQSVSMSWAMILDAWFRALWKYNDSFYNLIRSFQHMMKCPFLGCWSRISCFSRNLTNFSQYNLSDNDTDATKHFLWNFEIKSQLQQKPKS